jgi:hypothetical protein
LNVRRLRAEHNLRYRLGTTDKDVHLVEDLDRARVLKVTSKTLKDSRVLFPDTRLVEGLMAVESPSMEAVRLFDLRGNLVPLQKIRPDFYFVQRRLEPGVYLLKVGKKTSRLFHSFH